MNEDFGLNNRAMKLMTGTGQGGRMKDSSHLSLIKIQIDLIEFCSNCDDGATRRYTRE